MTDKQNQEIQILEQNLHKLLLHKQTFEIELVEIKSTSRELEKSKGGVFKIIGQLMLAKDRVEIKKELLEREKNMISNIEILKKQESSLLEKISGLRKK